MNRLAITIGCYKLVPFIRLNVLRCRRLLPGVRILLSDDKSPESRAILDLACELDCDYVCGPRRRSHFSGDAQAIVNSIVFAEECGVEAALKISQRLIPVLPSFFGALERAFKDPDVQVVLPGRINKAQISRMSARFYAKFGILTDVIGFRRGAISPDEFLAVYRDRCKEGRHPSDSFCETSVGYLLDKRFGGDKHRIIPEWTNHQHGMPKLYLRKSQSTTSDYCQIAAMENLPTDVSTYDLREWREIEGAQNYRAKATVV